MDEALSEAAGSGTPYTLAFVLNAANWIDWIIGSPAVHIEEALAMSTEHNFPFFLRLGTGIPWEGADRGWPSAGGPCATYGGFGGTACQRGRPSTPLLFSWLAEAHAIFGQPVERRDCLAEAGQIIEASDERAEAELLHRVPGDLLNAAGDRPGAERHYRQAIAVAERQSGKLFHLRASISLARLWRDQGKHGDACDLLGPIYGWFTEGFDAPDLKDAKALLDELA